MTGTATPVAPKRRVITVRYLPKDLRIGSRIVEGQVTKKQRDPNRVLVKIETQQGVILAAFTKRMAEIDLLVEPGDTIALALPGNQPFVDDPSIERVKPPK
jgi:hypothetical protein